MSKQNAPAELFIDLSQLEDMLDDQSGTINADVTQLANLGRKVQVGHYRLVTTGVLVNSSTYIPNKDHRDKDLGEEEENV